MRKNVAWTRMSMPATWTSENDHEVRGRDEPSDAGLGLTWAIGPACTAGRRSTRGQWPERGALSGSRPEGRDFRRHRLDDAAGFHGQDPVSRGSRTGVVGDHHDRDPVLRAQRVQERKGVPDGRRDRGSRSARRPAGAAARWRAHGPARRAAVRHRRARVACAAACPRGRPPRGDLRRGAAVVPCTSRPEHRDFDVATRVEVRQEVVELEDETDDFAPVAVDVADGSEIFATDANNPTSVGRVRRAGGGAWTSRILTGR